MKRFFNLLAITMIVLLGVAVSIMISHFQPIETPKPKPVIDSKGEQSTRGLPAEYADFVKKAQGDEGQACAAADTARNAADNAKREADRADRAADEPGHGDFQTSGSDGPGRYTGQVQGGQRQGVGVENYDNGSTYKGDWDGGRQDGLGVFNGASGNRYAGHWVQGSESEEGVLSLSNGQTYEGTLEKNKASGYGVVLGSRDDAFDQILGRTGDLEFSPVVVRYKNGKEWILVLKSSGGGASANKSGGYCVEIDSKTQIPLRAGSCLDDAGADAANQNPISRLNQEPVMTQTDWPKGPSDQSDAFPRDQQCSNAN